MFHLFARYAYEEHEFKSFSDKQTLAAYIAKCTEQNERDGTGWHLVAVVEGKELPIKIVKKKTEVQIG